MFFRRFAIAASVLAFCSVAAQAADLAPQAVEPVVPAVLPFSWSGFYAGINGGYASGSGHTVRMTETENSDPTYAFTDRYGKLASQGGFGGGQVGYNAQFGSFVLGLEGDIQGAGVGDKTTAKALAEDYILTTRTQTNWFGTVRPRVGFALDNILIYATGGLAFGGVKVEQAYYDPRPTNPYSSSPKKSTTRVGWAAGGGLEYGITQNWSVKLEYQYVNLGMVKLRGHERGPIDDFYINSRLKTAFHTVRLGVNYRF